MCEYSSFVDPIESVWPWTLPLANVHMVATRFDHRSLDDKDFSRYGIPLPPSLQSAVAKRRAEFLAGRLCARRALLMLNGSEDVPGIRGDRAPQWPEGCVGSITHSDDRAAALVTHRDEFLGLGLDMERLLSNADGRKLAGDILTTEELARLARFSSEQVGFIVTLTFSLKESLFKALYPLIGKFFYFEHAELVEWDISGAARLRLLRDLDREWSTGCELNAQFRLVDGCVLSLVAIPTPGLGGLLGANTRSGFTGMHDAT